MKFGESVHIVPLGFEFDRAAKLFKKHKPDKVYLLITPQDPKYPPEMNKDQEHFNKINADELKANDIHFEFVDADIFDMLKTADSVSKLIIKEIEGDNRKRKNIYVNMSAAGKKTSIGATLAARAQGAQVYYVFADGYSQGREEYLQHGISICDNPTMDPLPNFQIQKLDLGLLQVLGFLSRTTIATSDEIITFLKGQGYTKFDDASKVIENIRLPSLPNNERRSKMDEVRGIKQRNSNRLNKSFLNKLKEDDYIDRRIEGRNSNIWITESGKFALALHGMLY